MNPPHDPSRDPRQDVGQAGLTLIELMVSMVIAAIVIGMILGTHARLSSAYRSQTKVGQLGTTLRSVRSQITDDIRQAGYLIPDGFLSNRFGSVTTPVPPIIVDNDSGGIGPDQITVFYAIAEPHARVTGFAADVASATVDVSTGFAGQNLVLLVNPRIEGGDTDTSGIGHFDACLVKLSTVVGGMTPTLYFPGVASFAPFNAANNTQCAAVVAATADEGSDSETVAYKLGIRSYRIDPARAATGVLQLSTNALDPTPTWSDLAVGVVNLQVATRYYEKANTDDLDGDGQDERDWYSGDGQERVDTTGERPADAVQLEVALSLEVRTLNEIGGVGSVRSASFTDETDAPDSYEHSSIGDWPAVDLVGSDPDRPLAYQGRYLLRSSTTSIDLRNVGVGR